MTRPASVRREKKEIGIPVRLEQNNLKGLKVARTGTENKTSIEMLPPHIIASLKEETPIASLKKTLSALDKDPKVQKSEVTRTSYISTAGVPGEATFQVTISDNEVNLDVYFPPERDQQPSAKNAGKIWDQYFPKFIRDVENFNGKQIKKVKIFLERGTFDYVDDKGKEHNGVKYVTAYIFPLDEKGRYITGAGDGTYLVWEASQYGSDYSSGRSLLKEPDNANSLLGG